MSRIVERVNSIVLQFHGQQPLCSAAGFGILFATLIEFQAIWIEREIEILIQTPVM